MEKCGKVIGWETVWPVKGHFEGNIVCRLEMADQKSVVADRLVNKLDQKNTNSLRVFVNGITAAFHRINYLNLMHF